VTPVPSSLVMVESGTMDQEHQLIAAPGSGLQSQTLKLHKESDSSCPFQLLPTTLVVPYIVHSLLKDSFTLLTSYPSSPLPQRPCNRTSPLLIMVAVSFLRAFITLNRTSHHAPSTTRSQASLPFSRTCHLCILPSPRCQGHPVHHWPLPV
jgi:hypothetical protein